VKMSSIEALEKNEQKLFISVEEPTGSFDDEKFEYGLGSPLDLGRPQSPFNLQILGMSDREITRTPLWQVEKEFVDYQTLEKVRVICRFRPSSKQEKREEKQMGLEQCDPTINGHDLHLTRSWSKDLTKSPAREKTFWLDEIIDWKSSQNRCFRVIGFPMVESVVAGYNATIFAYGQTGAGKTHTMFGPEGHSPRHVGLIQRCMAKLFRRLNKRKKKKHVNEDGFIDGFTVTVHFMQIYKEKLYDLLNPNQDLDLRIRYDPRTKSPYVENVTMNVVNDTADVLRLTKIARSNRIIGKSDINTVSSRSHLLMSVNLEQNKSDGTKVTSKLNFGDLAGSESARKSFDKVERKQWFEELKFINSSLSNLTTVINDVVNHRRPAFRSSRLTQLLQDSLGGNTKTTIIVCCSPHITNREETIRSLKFAQTAKRVENKAKVNTVYTSNKFEKIISDLRAENKAFEDTVSSLEAQLKLLKVGVNLEKSNGWNNLMSQVSEQEKQISSQRAEDSKVIQDLKDQLRLKGLDLEACNMQIEELQDEIQSGNDGRQTLEDQIEQWREKFDGTRKKLDELLTEKLKLDLSVKSLQEQLDGKATVINQWRESYAELENRIKILDEEVVSRELKIQDLYSQKPMPTSDAQKASSVITAEEILVKYHLDESILSSLQSELSRVLSTWRSRKKHINTVLSTENTAFAVEARNVIKFFELAMSQLETHEKTQKDRGHLLAQIKKREEEIRRLNKIADSLKNHISEFDSPMECLHRLESTKGNERNYVDEELLSYLNKSSDEQEDEETKEAEEALLQNIMAPESDTNWRAAIKTGDVIDALDLTDLWFQATVLKVRNEGNVDQLLIHYKGFDNRYDEWIPRLSKRLSEFGSRATGGKESAGVENDLYTHIGERNGENYVEDGWMDHKSYVLPKVSFQSQYFVLFENGMLRYYTSKSEETAKGTINLCMVKKIEIDKAENQQGAFQFSLLSSGKGWSLRVNSKNDMDAWIAALKTVRRKVVDKNFIGWLKEHRPNNHWNVDARRTFRKKIIDSEACSPRNWGNASSGAEAIHRGNLWLMNMSINSWSKRFVELRDNETIVYYEASHNGVRPSTKALGSVDIWGVLSINQLSSAEAEIVQLPDGCIVGVLIETINTGKIIVGMADAQDLEKWTNIIAENCVFAGDGHKRSCSGFWENMKNGNIVSRETFSSSNPRGTMSESSQWDLEAQEELSPLAPSPKQGDHSGLKLTEAKYRSNLAKPTRTINSTMVSKEKVLSMEKLRRGNILATDRVQQLENSIADFRETIQQQDLPESIEKWLNEQDTSIKKLKQVLAKWQGEKIKDKPEFPSKTPTNMNELVLLKKENLRLQEKVKKLTNPVESVSQNNITKLLNDGEDKNVRKKLQWKEQELRAAREKLILAKSVPASPEAAIKVGRNEIDNELDKINLLKKSKGTRFLKEEMRKSAQVQEELRQMGLELEELKREKMQLGALLKEKVLNMHHQLNEALQESEKRFRQELSMKEGEMRKSFEDELRKAKGNAEKKSKEVDEYALACEKLHQQAYETLLKEVATLRSEREWYRNSKMATMNSLSAEIERLRRHPYLTMCS